MDTLYPSTIVQNEYGEFFNRWDWEWFVTLTFTDSVHPERAVKLFRVWVSLLNKSQYGRRWFKRIPYGVHWVLAVEHHKSGNVHLHALVGSTRDARRLSWMDNWHYLDPKCGYARVEAIKKNKEASSYVTKYAAKGGDLSFSDNLDNPQISLLSAIE